MTDNDCGCCMTPAAAIPAEISNRPGLSAIAYRIGTFTTFRKAITDELSRVPELARLGARVSEDYTITAIELWSAVADVLTFYQERLANEAFLRTATLRDSMLRLVRLIGYELAPGAAATTRLAFTLEPAARALIPVGTRVKSVPAQGENSQTYETLEALWAIGAINRLRVFGLPGPGSPLAAGATFANAAPDSAALAALAAVAAGERVMLYASSATEVLTVKELRVTDDVLTVHWETPVGGTSFVAAFDATDPAMGAYKLGRSFHLFGFDAPPVIVVPLMAVAGDPTTTFLTQALTDYTLHGEGSTTTQLSLDGRYEGLKPESILLAVATTGTTTKAIPFKVTAVVEKQVQRMASTTLAVSLAGTITQVTLAPLKSGATVNDLISASGGDIRNIVIHELLGDALRFWPNVFPESLTSRQVFLPGRRSGWASLTVGRTIEKGAYKGGTRLDLADLSPGRQVLLTDASGAAPLSASIAGAEMAGSAVSFEPSATDTVTISAIGLASEQTTPTTVLVSRTHAGVITLPSWPRVELTVTIGGSEMQTLVLNETTLSGGLPGDVATALQDAIRAALPGSPTFARAQVLVLANSAGDALAVAPGVPGDEVAFGSATNDADSVVAIGLDAANARFLDGVVSARCGPLATGGVMGTLRVTSGNIPTVDRLIFFFFANAASLATAIRIHLELNAFVTDDDRVLVLPELEVHEPRAFIRLLLNSDAPLALAASSAVLSGNVASASHGETVRREVLGDGDASQEFQRFALKKKPITYVPAAAPGGVASSLEVLVNGVLWDERPTLYGAGSRDQIYVARLADDGTLSVRFGDGNMGARPDTGRQNIVATYRHGTGLAGRVPANKLTTLLDRPTGVKGVTNLLPTDGGADPESLARAREAAPGSVRTFGRAVSLLDFEDTALMAGEAAKASASWVWNGERRAIHLTVAAQQGAMFSADGLARLLAALTAERDPNHRLYIANYKSVAVRISASLTVNSRYLNDEVLAAARAALLAALAFENRRFAEPVYLSDIYRVLQDVEGVLAVDIDLLDLKSTDPGFRAAHGVDDTLPQPQLRLLMLPARPAGGASMDILPAEIATVEVAAQDVTLVASGGLSS